MAVTGSGGTGDDAIEAVPPATQIERRPAPQVPLSDESPTRRRSSISPRTTVRATAGVAKVAWTAVSEVTAWTIDTALGVTGIVVQGSMAGTPPREVLVKARAEVRGAVRRALGLPAATAEPAVPTLREQGAALLRLSASTETDQPDSHPAFAGMLAELTPDEARILRFLHLDGPQPSIDIRTGRPHGLGTRRFISGLTLIGEHAGLRFPNRVPRYLTNLRRLELIEFAEEPVGNPNRYQLLEAQSPVRELVKRSRFGTKVSYRSIVLTDFGADFVQVCLPVVVSNGSASGTS